MVVDLGFWEKGDAKIVRSYLITTSETASENAAERFSATILPAASNFPAGAPYDPVFGSSHQAVKIRAISAIRGRPENNGLQSFSRKA